MKKFFLSNHLFFLIENGKIILWNYAAHEQYVLDLRYFTELLKISENGIADDSGITKEFSQAGIIFDTVPPADEWGWDDLSKIFHIGTQNTRDPKTESTTNFNTDYLNGCDNLDHNIPTFFLEKQGKKISLPTPDVALLDNISFYRVLKNRKTCRVFQSQTISLEKLSAILFSSFGLIHGYEWTEFSVHGLKQTGIRKASPASGGLHVEEAYVIAYRVDGLQSGLYYYHPKLHALVELALGEFEEDVINMNFNQTYEKGLSFGIYITARFEKSWWKYKHSRSYRVALLDIGHVAQTFQLCATAVGLNTWITGAFQDDQVSQLLNINGKSESPILFVGAGIGTGEAFPNEMLPSMKKC